MLHIYCHSSLFYISSLTWNSNYEPKSLFNSQRNLRAFDHEKENMKIPVQNKPLHLDMIPYAYSNRHQT